MLPEKSVFGVWFYTIPFLLRLLFDVTVDQCGIIFLKLSASDNVNCFLPKTSQEFIEPTIHVSSHYFIYNLMKTLSKSQTTPALGKIWTIGIVAEDAVRQQLIKRQLKSVENWFILVSIELV